MPDAQTSVHIISADAARVATMSAALRALGVEPQSSATAPPGVQPGTLGLVDVTSPIDPHEQVARLILREPDLTVVAFAEGASAEQVVAAVRAGAVDFVIEPLGAAVLSGVLERHSRRLAPPANVRREEGAPLTTGEIGDPDVLRMRRRLRSHLRSAPLSLPVSGRMLRRLAELSEAPNLSLDDVVTLLEGEILLAQAVMRNAARTARRDRPLSSIREAAALLGARRALGIASTAAAQGNYRVSGREAGALAGRIWLNHSLTAHTTQLMADHLCRERPDRDQSIALLAQIGEVYLLRLAHELWPAEIANGRPTARLCGVLRAERAAVSAQLLSDWGLPAEYLAVARYDAAHPIEEVPTEFRATVALVTLARFAAQGLFGSAAFRTRAVPRPRTPPAPARPRPGGHGRGLPTGGRARPRGTRARRLTAQRPPGGTGGGSEGASRW